MSHLPKRLKQLTGQKVNVMELGFGKLKDLVLTLPEIIVEVRENNHSYAMIRPNKVIEDSALIDIIIGLLEPYTMGISDRDLDLKAKE